MRIGCRLDRLKYWRGVRGLNITRGLIGIGLGMRGWSDGMANMNTRLPMGGRVRHTMPR